jgi:L-ascorbate metabolism protein UlaG (beta-lactamase superfamily)
MITDEVKLKYIGGPTLLLELGGLRFLTDPSFDPKDTLYDTGIYVLHKLDDPIITTKAIGTIDFVLLTHDHHFDNLDREGRKMLSHAKAVYTTLVGAGRLDGNAIGLKTWETIEFSTPDGRTLLLTGTPCRHGPVGGDRGPVTGFILQFKEDPGNAIYITGDTVLYEGVEEVARRFQVKMLILFLGAAVVSQVGPAHLTMTVEEGIQAARLFSDAIIVPMHFEGWAHFTESKSEIEEQFGRAGLLNRLQWASEFEMHG